MPVRSLRESGYSLGQVLLGQGGQAVGLVHLAGYLRQEAVRRQADGAQQVLAYTRLDLLLYPAAHAEGFFRCPLSRGQLEEHLVDGGDLVDGQNAIYRRDYLLVDPHVLCRARLDYLQPRTQSASLGDPGPRPCTVLLCLVAGSDAAGALRHHGGDGYGTAPQLRTELLLDLREVRVHVQRHPPRSPGAFCVLCDDHRFTVRGGDDPAMILP